MISEILVTVFLLFFQPTRPGVPSFISEEMVSPFQETFEDISATLPHHEGDDTIAGVKNSLTGVLQKDQSAERQDAEQKTGETQQFISEELKKGNFQTAIETNIQLKGIVKAFEKTSGTHTSFATTTALTAQLEAALAHAQKEGSLGDIIEQATRNGGDHLLHTRAAFINKVDTLPNPTVEQVEQELTLAEQILVTLPTYLEKKEFGSALELLEEVETHIFKVDIILSSSGVSA